ncbi:LIRP-like [Ceratitis capitata]|uniref:LIRP-like n=1 Tax=Ceratitis capitata TaxID=7213 RepID=UPI0006188612|nr:LIRP-like [Ceratitis capitata]
MSSILLKISALLLILLATLEQSSSDQTLCGPTIDMVLSTVCENGFNTRFKKSMEWRAQENSAAGDELPFAYESTPFLAKIHGGQVDTVAKSRRRRQGVYDECCRKPCRMSELISYCK